MTVCLEKARRIATKRCEWTDALAMFASFLNKKFA
jgi:hypothetical protein